jgi:hypothetical protein
MIEVTFSSGETVKVIGFPCDVVPSHSPTLSDENPSIGIVDGNGGRTQALWRINATDRHNHRTPAGSHASAARGAGTNPSLDCT